MCSEEWGEKGSIGESLRSLMQHCVQSLGSLLIPNQGYNFDYIVRRFKEVALWYCCRDLKQ